MTEVDKQEFKGLIELLVELKIVKMRCELEALWLHIRNLEEKLLVKSETPKSSKELRKAERFQELFCCDALDWEKIE